MHEGREGLYPLTQSLPRHNCFLCRLRAHTLFVPLLFVFFFSDQDCVIDFGSRRCVREGTGCMSDVSVSYSILRITSSGGSGSNLSSHRFRRRHWSSNPVTLSPQIFASPLSLLRLPGYHFFSKTLLVNLTSHLLLACVNTDKVLISTSVLTTGSALLSLSLLFPCLQSYSVMGKTRKLCKKRQRVAHREEEKETG